MIYDLTTQCLILMFTVRFIEDAVRLMVMKTDAAEEVGGVEA